MADKGPLAFRTISEAVAEVGAPAHVLRFWETKFSVLKPMRRAGGRRFYRPEDVRILKALRRLLHEQRRRIGDLQNLSRADLLALSSENLFRTAVPRPSSPNLHGLQSALAAAVSVKKRLDGLLATAWG